MSEAALLRDLMEPIRCHWQAQSDALKAQAFDLLARAKVFENDSERLAFIGGMANPTTAADLLREFMAERAERYGGAK